MLLIASLGVVVYFAGLLFVSLSLAKKYFGVDEAEGALSSIRSERPSNLFCMALPLGTVLPALAADLWVLCFNRFLSCLL